MTVTFNENAYLKERTLIQISGIASGAKIGFDDLTEGAILTDTVYYTPSADHKLTIDVTDLVRVECKIGEYFEFGIFEDIQGGDTYQDSIYVAGDTNKDEWIVPQHPIDAWSDNDIPIGLPRMILQPKIAPTLLPILADSGISNVHILYDSAHEVNISSGWNTLQFGIDAKVIDLIKRIGGSATLLYPQETKDIPACDKYALVEWRDRAGLKKRTVWQVREVTENLGDKQEIEDLTNAYDVRKGSVTTMTLHLDGLTAYDVWYYADIITSSDVRVAMKASDYDSSANEIRAQYKVEVTTKKIEIPDGDGGEFYSLDVEINYKRYDTV